jgi:hypothetical protein
MTSPADALALLSARNSRQFDSLDGIAPAMRELIAACATELPLPAAGQTLQRWKALAAVGALNLSLAKIYEGHTDALAILSELEGTKWEGLWAVWAAEAPYARLIYEPADGGTVSGRKLYCSGARIVDFALVSAWTEDEEPILVQLNLRSPGITIETAGWEAVGMASCESVPVTFDKAKALPVGSIGAYISRAGFWQGGAGIAAVWYGAAEAIANVLLNSPRVAKDPYAAVHLGKIDLALRAAKALLVETAGWIDDHPMEDASGMALRVRLLMEDAANEIILRTGKALGPGPLCTNATHARRCADLPVFIRQSHAEHDLAALGRGLNSESSGWKL